MNRYEPKCLVCGSQPGACINPTACREYGLGSERQSRQDDEEVLHAMRFLGTDSPEQAIHWLAQQDRAAE